MKLFGWYQQTSPIRAKVRRGAAGRDDACGAQWLKQSVGCKERVRTNRREITHIHRACFFSAILNATCIDSPAGLQRLFFSQDRRIDTASHWELCSIHNCAAAKATNSIVKFTWPLSSYGTDLPLARRRPYRKELPLWNNSQQKPPLPKELWIIQGVGGLHLLIAFNSTVVEQNGQFRIPGVPIHKDFRRASYTPM